MDVDYVEGRLFLHKRVWYLDAEPNILVLFERLFPGSKIAYSYNLDDVDLKFTHRARTLNDSLSVRKDIAYDYRISPGI